MCIICDQDQHAQEMQTRNKNSSRLIIGKTFHTIRRSFLLLLILNPSLSFSFSSFFFHSYYTHPRSSLTSPWDAFVLFHPCSSLEKQSFSGRKTFNPTMFCALSTVGMGKKRQRHTHTLGHAVNWYNSLKKYNQIPMTTGDTPTWTHTVLHSGCVICWQDPEKVREKVYVELRKEPFR